MTIVEKFLVTNYEPTWASEEGRGEPSPPWILKFDIFPSNFFELIF